MSKPTINELREAARQTGGAASDVALLLAALSELEAYRARDREQLNTIRRASGFALLDGPL